MVSHFLFISVTNTTLTVNANSSPFNNYSSISTNNDKETTTSSTVSYKNSVNSTVANRVNLFNNELNKNNTSSLDIESKNVNREQNQPSIYPKPRTMFRYPPNAADILKYVEELFFVKKQLLYFIQ